MAKKNVWKIVSVWIGLVLLGGIPARSEIREVAPGVYWKVIEDGCNTGWVIFKDYVFVVDADFPNQAQTLLEDIRKTTDKPVRFVFDTHSHWDHSYGNGVYARAGATIIAQRYCYDELVKPSAIEAFNNWAKDKPEAAKLGLVAPTLLFDDRMVFDDGQRRLELLYFGHAHTRGDAVAYLPKEKILFTGDLCINGAYNYLGEADTENWIRVMSEVQELRVETICPGHGPVAKSDLLETQKQFFIQLRQAVQKAIDDGKPVDEMLKTVDVPLYRQWTGKPMREDHIRYVYNELTGLITPWALVKMGLTEGPSPTKQSPDWTPPKKMLTRGLDEKALMALKRVAPNLEWVNARNDREALEKIADVDGMMGPLSPKLFQAAKKLRWVHSRSAGVEGYFFPEFVKSDMTLTNGRGLFGPAIADHVMGMILMFSKGLAVQHERQLKSQWGRAPNLPIHDLQGQTMLILGLGGIGREVAQRAAGFGMKIIAVDPKPIDRPRSVSHIGPPQEMDALLPTADVVVCCVPLTPKTDKYINRERFQRMKPSAYFINISRGEVVDQEALVEALKSKTIAGAGLDVTDPEPLPSDHPLWKLDNLILTPHMSGQTGQSWDRVWLLLRENVRRFAIGEPLLNVVDKQAGY